MIVSVLQLDIKPPKDGVVVIAMDNYIDSDYYSVVELTGEKQVSRH